MGGKCPSYFDPEGITEPENTVYTLQVLCPTRPSTNIISAFFRSRRTTNYGTGSAYTIRPDDNNPNLDCFLHQDLEDMDRKTYRVKRALFPVELRCDHLRYSTTCMEGCYVLEKGGDWCRRKCGRRREGDCQGHVYISERVKTYDNGKSCFGEKGSRMVCLLEKAPPRRRR
jgi:hypothetical protein